MDSFLTRLLKYGTLISTYCLIGSVLLQIFARFFLSSAPSWTEEASRLFFIYAIAFAAGLAVKNKYYVSLDLFVNQFSLKTRQRLEIAISALTLFLFAVLAVFSLKFIVMGHAEYSPSMKIRMSTVFFSMLVMGASMSYFIGREIFRILKKERS